MNYYRLLKLNGIIKNQRIKFLGLFLLYKLGRRYLAVHFDPVMACNLRCKMCYFTDADYVKKLKGIFKKEELPTLSKAILDRAIKLQVGCGTEPTLYKDLSAVFKAGKDSGVPHISMTTNANLINETQLTDWVNNGLSEITVSLHGVYKETYEEMMGRGDYDKFLNALAIIQKLKSTNPYLQLRINYTFNEDNFDELYDFWKVFDQFDINTLQIRPIIKIGETAYNNFSLDKILPKYQDLYNNLIIKAKENGTSILIPTLAQLSSDRKSEQSTIREYTYCYISPNYFWRPDMNFRKETFDQFARRTGWAREIWQNIFASKNKLSTLKNEALNYDIS